MQLTPFGCSQWNQETQYDCENGNLLSRIAGHQTCFNPMRLVKRKTPYGCPCFFFHLQLIFVTVPIRIYLELDVSIRRAITLVYIMQFILSNQQRHHQMMKFRPKPSWPRTSCPFSLGDCNFEFIIWAHIHNNFAARKNILIVNVPATFPTKCDNWQLKEWTSQHSE